jgi:serine/threonine-protein kinase PRP4
LIHADLKPDNILISASLNTVKIADLGSAVEEDENEPTPYLVSRFYRAPEIILGHKYTTQVDVWACAATLYEIFTGSLLFNGKTNNDMLRVIMEVKGKFSTKLIKGGRAEVWQPHFTPDLDFKWDDVDKATGETRVRVVSDCSAKKNLEQLLIAKAKTGSNSDPEHGYYMKKVRQFGDMLSKCLALDPNNRLSPDDALAHPFIKEPFELKNVKKDAAPDKSKRPSK